MRAATCLLRQPLNAASSFPRSAASVVSPATIRAALLGW